MRVYRAERADGTGPYRPCTNELYHREGFRGPGIQYQDFVYAHPTWRFACASLRELREAFDGWSQRAVRAGFAVTEYEVPADATYAMNCDAGVSPQLLFDPARATKVARFALVGPRVTE